MAPRLVLTAMLVGIAGLIGYVLRACAAHDTYACGMFGSTLVREAHGDLTNARTSLERGCETEGYFACEVLATMIERGELGEPDDEAALRARERGCDTGYAPSCAHLPEPRPAPPPPAAPSPLDHLPQRSWRTTR